MKNSIKTIHYHLNDHIYIAQFRDEIIFLDTKQDVYTICSQHFSRLLVSLLERRQSYPEETPFFSSDSQFSSQEIYSIQKLIDDKIIKKTDTLYPFYIYRKSDSKGVSNVNWSLPLNNKNVPFNIQVLKALGTLIKVNFYINIRGFYSTINLIKTYKEQKIIYIVPEDEELNNLANIVNKACLIYPTRTKCLEWAITFVLLALKRKWKCNLEIGVQNYPFLAHAWVECNDKVVMDSPDLREDLAIILNEPFRKLKI